MSEAGGPAAAAEALLGAFSVADFERMRETLDEHVVAHITNAGGGIDRVEGRETLLGRIEAMDLPAVRYSVELTQPPVEVDAERALVMVEVRAERDGRTLHNFAAHLFRAAGGRISEWRMVDAKPAESDRFWS